MGPKIPDLSGGGGRSDTTNTKEWSVEVVEEERETVFLLIIRQIILFLERGQKGLGVQGRISIWECMAGREKRKHNILWPQGT